MHLLVTEYSKKQFFFSFGLFFFVEKYLKKFDCSYIGNGPMTYYYHKRSCCSSTEPQETHESQTIRQPSTNLTILHIASRPPIKFVPHYTNACTLNVESRERGRMSIYIKLYNIHSLANFVGVFEIINQYTKIAVMSYYQQIGTNYQQLLGIIVG